MSRKFYVEVIERNPFGEEVDDSVISRPDRSSTFVPGYSDKRHAKEVAALEGRETPPLEHRFHWARRMNVSGEDFGQGVQRQHDMGYEIAKYDDVIKRGYDLTKNKAIRKAADGSAVLGDVVLTWIDAKGAAAHWKANREANDALERRPQEMMDDAIHKFNTSNVARRGGMKASHFEFVEDDKK